MAEYNLVSHLIKDSSNTKNQYRIRIVEHTLRQLPVETAAKLYERQHQQHYRAGADKVEQEGISHIAASEKHVVDNI